LSNYSAIVQDLFHLYFVKKKLRYSYDEMQEVCGIERSTLNQIMSFRKPPTTDQDYKIKKFLNTPIARFVLSELYTG
jgi:transcriptional regulator with XRE-family HTH domain